MTGAAGDPVLRRVFVAGGLTAAGAASVALAVFGPGLWAALACHVLATFLCLPVLWRDRPAMALVAGASLTLGPLAGPVLLIALTGPGRALAAPGPEADDLPAGPAQSRADRICAEIAEGRRPRPDAAPVPALAEIFVSGSLADQQTALAAMVRDYAPALRPALDRALASDIPAVRVQAAAVFAHLRDGYAARARALTHGTTGLTGEAHSAELAVVRGSGFVDPAALDGVVTPAEPDAHTRRENDGTGSGRRRAVRSAPA